MDYKKTNAPTNTVTRDMVALSSDTGKHTIRTMRCPNCGETATVHGNTWECGWCGDHGFIK